MLVLLYTYILNLLNPYQMCIRDRFDGAQDLLISLPGADGDEIRSRLAVIIGLQPQEMCIRDSL